MKSVINDVILPADFRFALQMIVFVSPFLQYIFQ